MGTETRAEKKKGETYGRGSVAEGMRGAPSTKSNHIIQRDIVKGGEGMATK